MFKPEIWIVAALTLSGCGPADAGDDIPVTGEGPTDPTWLPSQSETAIAVVPPSDALERIVVTYNDSTPNDDTVLYTPTARTILRGATLMGWSFSDDLGQSWAYGGAVAPPTGWAVLWGDPAITYGNGDVYISNLAVPDSKYPATGGIADITQHLGGACVARSTDRGRTFQPYRCVSDQGRFYDGASLAATGNELYGAWENVDTAQTDVWNVGGFYKLAPPFAGKAVVSHPRLRAVLRRPYPDQQAFVEVYVAAQVLEADNTYSVYANRYFRECFLCGGHWTGAKLIDTVTPLFPSVRMAPGDPWLRTGPQFSFDVAKTSGLTEPGPDDEVRFVITHWDGSRYYLKAIACELDLTNCHEVPEWGTASTTGASQFNPNIAVTSPADQSRTWKVSYLATDGPPGTTSNLIVWQGSQARLAGGPVFLPNQLVGSHHVCADLRGYWGDYDDLQVVREPTANSAPTFVRAQSDSDAGCSRQWEYTQRHLHVSASVFQ